MHILEQKGFATKHSSELEFFSTLQAHLHIGWITIEYQMRDERQLGDVKRLTLAKN